MHRASDEENVIQFSDVDVGANFETRRGSLGHSIERDVYGSRIVRWRANAADVPLPKRAILRGDYGVFTRFHVARHGCRNRHASDEGRGTSSTHECSQAASLERHRASFDGVEPNRGNVHAGFTLVGARADSPGNTAADPVDDSLRDSIRHAMRIPAHDIARNTSCNAAANTAVPSAW